MTIGDSEPGSSRPREIDNFCELLTASNIPFDIVSAKAIDEKTFADKSLVKYVAAIVAAPFSEFSNQAFRLLGEASHNLGISLVSSYRHADERSKELFGIRSLAGRRALWPLKIKIISWPRTVGQEKIIADYGFLSGFPGIRTRGLKKLAVRQTWKKLLRIFRSLLFPYRLVELKPEARVIATNMKGTPLVWSNTYGRAVNYYIAMDGGLFLGKFNEMHKLVRALLETNSGFGLASIGLENSMALRLDDPGACSADYLDRGGVLLREDWVDLGHFLKNKGIPLSVVYAPGWVDDGDNAGGKLFIDGRELVERRAGSVYDSSLVRYLTARGGGRAYDHSSEFEGLKSLAQERLIEVHSHGLTHLDPDHKGWARAKDKNSDTRWYHEFYHVKTGRSVERREQSYALSASRDRILSHFGSRPLAFTPSGHRHGSDSDLLCIQTGYLLFSADYTAFPKNTFVVRNWKIRSVFLYLKSPTPFAASSGYPFIGVVHDYEIKNGLDRLSDVIEKWRVCGVKRFLSMNDLALSLCSTIDAQYDIQTSSLNLRLSLPTRPGGHDTFSELAGRKIQLRIVLPDNTMPLDTPMSVSGGTLVSCNKDAEGGIMTLLLESSESPAINIHLPVMKRSLGRPGLVKKGCRAADPVL